MRTPQSCRLKSISIPPPRTGPNFIILPFGAIRAPPVAPAKVMHDRANAVGTMTGSSDAYTITAGASVMPPKAAKVPTSAVRLVGFVLGSV